MIIIRMHKLLTLLWIFLMISLCCGCIDKYPTCGCKKVKLPKDIRGKDVKGKSKPKEKMLECSQINVESMFANADLHDKKIVALSITNNIVEEVSNKTFGSRPDTLAILQQVKMLDLSENQIGKILPHAFVLFQDLRHLNLSGNSVGHLSSDMLYGLSNLTFLDLSYNLIPIIPGDMFQFVPNLQRFFVNSNDLVCNCLMRPFIDWLKGRLSESPVKVRGTCYVPQRLKKTELRRLKIEDLACSPNDTLDTLPYFKMAPSAPQLAFEGDELYMLCEGTDLETTKVIWSYNGSDIDEKSPFITNTSHYIHRTVVSGSLKIENLTHYHSGTWKCTIASKYGSKSGVFELLVVEQSPKYCEFDTIHNRKGIFAWPEVITGVTASLECSVHGTRDAILFSARRTCNSPGQWIGGVYRDCFYTDIVARLVFDTLNKELTPSNVSQVTKKLISSLKSEVIRDPYSVELIADLCERLMRLAINSSKDNDIGSQILQLAGFVMNADPSILHGSPIASSACGRILRVVRNYALEIASSSFLSKSSPNIAIIGIKSSQYVAQADDIRCEVGDKLSQTTEPDLKFTCDMTPKTGYKTHSYVSVPSTLLNCTRQGRDGCRLNFIAYRNGNLFQNQHEDRGTNETRGGSGAVSPNMVIEVGINGKPVVNLTKAAIFGFVNPNSSVHTSAQWSPTDGWQKGDGCTDITSEEHKNLTVFACKKIMNITLAYDPNGKARFSGVDLSLISLAHPAVLAGTGVLLVFLIAVILSYICCYSKLGITSEARHMLINICTHLGLAACAFALGIWRVDNEALCVTCGILLHYSSLSVLLWIAISARNIHREMIIHNSPPTPEPKLKRPMLRFYLIGCGIPAVVCGITAAAKRENYGGDRGKYCWLSWETSVYAFYLPAAVTAIISIILLIRLLCALNRNTSSASIPRSPVSNMQPSSHECTFANNDRFGDMYGGDVTENTPLQYTSRSEHGNVSGQDGVSSMCVQPDNEQSYGTRLRGVSLFLFFFLATWVAAALSVAAPSFRDELSNSELLSNPDSFRLEPPYLRHSSTAVSGRGSDLSNVFSWVYAVLAIFTGIFLVVQHMVCRRDVRACWGKALSLCKGVRKASERRHGANSQTSSTPLRNGENTSTIGEGQESRVCTPPYDRTLTSHSPRKLHQDDLLPALPSDPSMLENVLLSGRIEEKRNGSRLTSVEGSHRNERSPERSWHTGISSSNHVKSLRSGSSHQPMPHQHHHGRQHPINGIGHPYHSHNSVHSGMRHTHGVSPHHPHMMESSSGRVYSQPVYSHDPCLAGSAGFRRDSPYGRYHHGQHSHSHLQTNGNPMKLTNLLMAHDSSMTEHSFDDLTQNNMHTIPVIMQHSQPKVDNGLLYYRYQKMRRALDQKKNKHNKLMVLREYAQDPLTSNDEDVNKTRDKDGDVNESSLLVNNDPKNNLLKNYSNQNNTPIVEHGNDRTKYKPLLIASPSGKKKEPDHSRGGAGQTRRNRLTERGGKNSIAATRATKQSKRRSENSTVSERERATTSSEKSDTRFEDVLPHHAETMVLERETDPQSILLPQTPTTSSSQPRPATSEKDNHGYLTLQQLMSVNSFLPQKPMSPEVQDSKGVDESIKDLSSEAMENESLSPSLGSSLLFKRNETSV